MNKLLLLESLCTMKETFWVVKCLHKKVGGCGMKEEEARAQSYLRKKKEVIGTATNQKKKLNVKSAASMAEENYMPRMLQCCCEFRSSLEIEIVAMLNRLNVFVFFTFRGGPMLPATTTTTTTKI